MFGLGQDLVKGGKMVTAAMALRAVCNVSGIGKYKITHTRWLCHQILNRSHQPTIDICSSTMSQHYYIANAVTITTSLRRACQCQDPGTNTIRD